MSPDYNKKNGGSLDRAASGSVIGRDAARVEDLRVLANCLILMAGTIALLVVSGPQLWPHLFAP
jgi:hypothetical protein